MRYRDVAAAIDWLSTAFGFSKHRIVTGDDGAILYGLLTFGDHMIMVWPVRDSDLDRLMKQPDEIGGAETQTCYLVVQDADVHYVNAKAAGADILLDIKDHDGLGRGYSCRDPEGHIWHFGTYDPWQSKTIGSRRRYPIGGDLRSFVLFGSVFVTMIAIASAGWMQGHVPTDEQGSRRTAEAIAATSRRADEIAMRAELLAAELAHARSAKQVAERRADGALEQLAKDRTATEAAQRAIEEAKRESTREREARQHVERTLQDMLEQIAFEKDAKEAAERATKGAKERLAEVPDESKSIAEAAEQEKHSKEIVERRSSIGADLGEAARNRRICGVILSDPEGYDRALIQLCLKVSRR